MKGDIATSQELKWDETVFTKEISFLKFSCSNFVSLFYVLKRESQFLDPQ